MSGGSDLGTIAPAGTVLNLADQWFDGAVSIRSGASFTVAAGASASLGASAALNAINGAGPAPTPAAVAAGAGTGSSVGTFRGHDLGGSFVLTTAGTPAAGVVATITFGTTLPAAPVSVVVTAVDTTGAPILAVNVGAGTFTTTGFSIATATALTTAHTYLISYQVVAS